jgi:hypothetical protein
MSMVGIIVLKCWLVRRHEHNLHHNAKNLGSTRMYVFKIVGYEKIAVSFS